MDEKRGALVSRKCLSILSAQALPQKVVFGITSDYFFFAAAFFLAAGFFEAFFLTTFFATFLAAGFLAAAFLVAFFFAVAILRVPLQLNGKNKKCNTTLAYIHHDQVVCKGL
jgi:uncharacterized membrane protein YciS (DUF1049 family)